MKDEDMLLLGLGALFLFKGRPAAAAEPEATSTAEPPTPAEAASNAEVAINKRDPLVSPSVKRAAKKKAAAGAARQKAGGGGDTGRFIARANQPGATAWIPALMRAGAPQGLAEGIARWIGLESGGNPIAKSKLNEVGLLQIMPTTARAVFTPAEYAALSNPRTDRETHARLALKQFSYHRKRAGLTDRATIPDQLFYSKVHHAYPRDLKIFGGQRPPVATIAPYMVSHAAGPNQKARAAAATVVAANALPPGF